MKQCSFFFLETVRNFEENSIFREKRIILNLQEHVKRSDRDEKEKKGAKRKRGFFKHGTILSFFHPPPPPPPRLRIR